MTEPMNGPHPEPAELQSIADGEAGTERVVAHLESCEVCRAEVAAIRRVTAALSLGSRPPDALLERVRARRAVSEERVVPLAPRRERASSRRYMLPLGLAAAAALAIMLPQALREPADEQPRSVSGAKGVTPVDVVVEERIVTETGATSIDSMSWDMIDNARVSRAELRYLTGVPESARAESLANRVAHRLREAGMDGRAITLIPVSAAPPESPPAGAVAVTIRARPAS
jgi:hypothetical protein